MLIDAVEHNDIDTVKRLVGSGAFSTAQLDALAIKIAQEQKYDPPMMEVLLPVLETAAIWNTIAFPRQLLYFAITQQDTPLVDKLLKMECVNSSDGITPGWCSYLEHAVYPTAANTDILARLLAVFSDSDGMALLRAVQQKNVNLVNLLLPHSNIAAEHFFATQWALMHNSDLVEVLTRVSCPVETLYGMVCAFPYRSDENEERALTQGVERAIEWVQQQAAEHPDEQTQAACAVALACFYGNTPSPNALGHCLPHHLEQCAHLAHTKHNPTQLAWVLDALPAFSQRVAQLTLSHPCLLEKHLPKVLANDLTELLVACVYSKEKKKQAALVLMDNGASMGTVRALLNSYLSAVREMRTKTDAWMDELEAEHQRLLLERNLAPTAGVEGSSRKL